MRMDAALTAAREFAEQSALGVRRLVVRDLRGRVRLFVAEWPAGEAPRKWAKPTTAAADAARAGLHALLGPWSPGGEHVLVDAHLLADFDRLWGDRDSLAFVGSPDVRMLERGLTGADWVRGPVENAAPSPPRAVFYGLKGGTGRTTTLALWARYLADDLGKRVLVLDLDLESPGLASMLLPRDRYPSFGVVDWFVEGGVGLEAEVLRDIAARSELSRRGEIIVVPAFGTDTGGYLQKLARVYLGDRDRTFGDRLGELVDALEARHQPDVVVIDSRAGLHDIAAVALTRLRAEAFLFAVDSVQTWEGFAQLLAPWRGRIDHDRARFDEVRRRLKLVAGQVPETGREAYLASFNQRAYEVFVNLYDEGGEIGDDSWAFGPEDSEAPHAPVRVFWRREFQGWDPVGSPGVVTPEQISGAFAEFFRVATERVLGEKPRG